MVRGLLGQVGRGSWDCDGCCGDEGDGREEVGEERKELHLGCVGGGWIGRILTE